MSKIRSLKVHVEPTVHFRLDGSICDGNAPWINYGIYRSQSASLAAARRWAERGEHPERCYRIVEVSTRVVATITQSGESK